MPSLEEELRELLLSCGATVASSSPDYALARFLIRCLEGWNEAMTLRDGYYGGPPKMSRPQPFRWNPDTQV